MQSIDALKSSQSLHRPKDFVQAKKFYQCEYYLRNIDALKLSLRRYYTQNKDRKRETRNQTINSESRRAYSVVNIDKLREYERLYHAENKDTRAEYQRQYYFKVRDRKKSSQCDNKISLKEYNQSYYTQNHDKILDAKRLSYCRQHGRNSYLVRVDAKSWKTPAIVREYFDATAKQLQIADYSDWYRISRVQMSDIGGE